MTTKSNAKPPRNAQASGTTPPANNPYSPSVPISLYREVASELQSAKATADSLKLQNQQLLEQNQKLRLEIERIVQSALQLRQVADTNGAISPVISPPLPELEVYFEKPSVPAAKPILAKPTSADSPKSDPPDVAETKPLFTEQETPSRHSTQSERPSEMGGWWLMAVICLIVVTAFGTGFFIVRPLLPQR